MTQHRFGRPAIAALGVAVTAALALAACGSSGGSAKQATASDKTLQIAYLSFAVANSYDAPMLAAAQAVAADQNAKVTVFDANNNPQTQFTQFQNAITSGKYDGIITQPILGTGLTSLVEQASAKGIKVVNIDQILGPDFSTNASQVKGLSANVVQVPTTMGTQMGEQVIAACASKSLDPCNIGYLYDIKASTLDVAIRKAFDAAIAGTPAVKIVAEGEDFFTPAGGLKATENMLQAHSDLSLVVASDQGIEGAVQALAATHKTGKVLLVGYGASAAGVAGVAAGDWFSDVAQVPASEGRLGMQALIKAIRTKVDGGAIDPTASLPNKAVVTKDNASQFTAEWPG
jgi:ribose transport system substrate-binding protein